MLNITQLAIFMWGARTGRDGAGAKRASFDWKPNLILLILIVSWLGICIHVGVDPLMRNESR